MGGWEIFLLIGEQNFCLVFFVFNQGKMVILDIFQTRFLRQSLISSNPSNRCTKLIFRARSDDSDPVKSSEIVLREVPGVFHHKL